MCHADDVALWRRDGTTSMVLLIGDLMKQSERYLAEGTHPRVLVEVSTRSTHTHDKSMAAIVHVDRTNCALSARASGPAGISTKMHSLTMTPPLPHLALVNTAMCTSPGAQP